MPSGSSSARLPVEIVPPTRTRRLVATIVGVLLLVALANAGAVWILARKPVNHGYQVIRAKWNLLARSRQPVDWLVLGDSSGNQGVVPEVLSERLGGSSLNLCTVGDLLVVNDAWMLETSIETVGPPRHILIVHAYDVWRRDPNVDAVAQIPLPFGFWSRKHPPLALSAAERARVLLDRYVPLYSQDQSLSRLLVSPGKFLKRPFEMDEQGYLRAPKAYPDKVRKDAEGQLRAVAKSRFSLSQANRSALEAIATMAQRHGIDVYIAGGPIYEGLYAAPAFRTHLSELRGALSALATAHPRLAFLDTEAITFRADEMTNADHLIDAAARRYTAFLADAILATERTRRSEPGEGRRPGAPFTRPWRDRRSAEGTDGAGRSTAFHAPGAIPPRSAPMAQRARSKPASPR